MLNNLNIKFTDGELIKNVDWKSLPSKTIQYMDFTEGVDTIRLMGFERYLCIKEYTEGVNFRFHVISKVILYGQSGSLVTKIEFDLINRTRKRTEVFLNEVYNGKEVAEHYWKAGQVTDKPEVYIKSL